jgi:hypothetical protein
MNGRIAYLIHLNLHCHAFILIKRNLKNQEMTCYLFINLVNPKEYEITTSQVIKNQAR